MAATAGAARLSALIPLFWRLILETSAPHCIGWEASLSIGTGHTPLVLSSITAFIQVGIATARETIVKDFFDSIRTRTRTGAFAFLG
jgi:hypothetical protein